MEKQNQTVLITGASNGIGYEFAKYFARQGYGRLVLAARSENKLRALAADLKKEHGTESLVVDLDLSIDQAADELARRLAENKIEVDILINNAGFGVYGPFADNSLETQSQMLKLNMLTLTRLTWLLLPAMRRKKSGGILNVASTASFQPGPLMACYYATKAYVLSFSEALHEELRGTGVAVSALCPGPTRTGFQEAAQIQKIRLVQWLTMDMPEVVEAGYQGLMKNQAVVIPGSTNKILVFLQRLTPRFLARRIVRYLQGEKR